MIKKNEFNCLSVAEQRRYEEIKQIQTLLADGFAPVQLKEMLSTTYARIRRYATGDPYNLCRFSNGNISQLDKYKTQIIECLNQNQMKKEIFEKIKALGYTGKMTALKVYCRKMIDELHIQYMPRKNIVGVTINVNNKLDVHFLNRQDLLKHLWCDSEINANDIEYLWNKYPLLSDLRLCISHFREIYIQKNPKLLDWFIALYSKSLVKSLASFANGLSNDISAVENSVKSQLSNGFVEGNNNRIKAIKRVMYGRAKIGLLSAKVILG